MATTFRPYEPDQMLLLAPDVRDWLPEGHLALDLPRIRGVPWVAPAARGFFGPGPARPTPNRLRPLAARAGRQGRGAASNPGSRLPAAGGTDPRAGSGQVVSHRNFCGLRSAFGSMVTLTSAGPSKASASSSAARRSAGSSTWSPRPPNASIMRS